MGYSIGYGAGVDRRQAVAYTMGGGVVALPPLTMNARVVNFGDSITKYGTGSDSSWGPGASNWDYHTWADIRRGGTNKGNRCWSLDGQRG